MPKVSKHINLNIEIDVLTSVTVGEIVNAILELLLFQRNQIPFVYKTLKYYTASWENKDTNRNADAASLNDFYLKKQRECVTGTKDSISAMRELIKKSFETNSIKCVRFLFGSTVYTPKEAYTIHIPYNTLTTNHFHEHHAVSHSTLNSTLIALLTSADLYDIFSHNLSATNVYLELEMLEKAIDHCNSIHVFPKEVNQLPSSCKDIHFHLYHLLPINFELSSLQCCKKLKIYEDESNLSEIKQNSDNTYEVKANDEYMLHNCASLWWEAKVVVRGFKNKFMKGINIWTK